MKTTLSVSVFDGTRTPLKGKRKLFTLLDGNKKLIHRGEHQASRVNFSVPVYGNLGDWYTAIVWATGYRQAGFYPVRVHEQTKSKIDLMLVPQDATFNFLRWPDLQSSFPTIASLFQNDAQYKMLLEDKPGNLACLMNIASALSSVYFSTGTAIERLREVTFDATMQCDRFFGWADESILQELEAAVSTGAFQRQELPGVFHPGATRSYKEKRFGEANLQISLHESEKKEIGGTPCVKVELDIDYYSDPLAHALLEVAVNHLTNSITDPAQVYVLRWMAGRHAGIAEFEPPYTLT